MKKLISIIIMICIAAIMFGDYFNTPSYREEVYRCDVCGKYLNAYVEVEDSYFSMPYVSSPSSFPQIWFSESNPGKKLIYRKEIQMCDECYEKYADDLIKKLDKVWSRSILKAKENHKDNWLIEEEKHKKKQMDEIDNQINKLKEKKEKL